MRQFNIKHISFLFGLLISFASCDKSNDETNGSNSSFTSGPVELPAFKDGEGNLFISHSTKFSGEDVTTYNLEYDCAKRHARWVAFKFFDLTAQKNWSRDDWNNIPPYYGDPFQDDPAIPQQYRSDREDFRGYDRGHICASEDRVYSQYSNEQTFYYSNMSPQYGDFNQNIWADLESEVRDWGRNNNFRDTLYVVKGGTIDKAEQIITYTNRGPNKLPVPKYYYMAMVCKKGDRFKAIAFWLDQSQKYTKPYTLSKYTITINKLEELTGIDFFHHLNDGLENAIESQLDKSAWPGL